jgi:hypothetical protein
LGVIENLGQNRRLRRTIRRGPIVSSGDEAKPGGIRFLVKVPSLRNGRERWKASFCLRKCAAAQQDRGENFRQCQTRFDGMDLAFLV